MSDIIPPRLMEHLDLLFETASPEDVSLFAHEFAFLAERMPSDVRQLHDEAYSAAHRLAFRQPSTLRIDSRVRFDDFDIDLIEARVRKRIFQDGKNANDQQMEPARSYPPPRGLYRYLTGDLYRSLQVSSPTLGVLLLTFNYSDLVMNTLEDRYGPIFQWSPSDERFVNELAKEWLRDNGLDADSLETFDRENAQKREAEEARQAEQRDLLRQDEPEDEGADGDAGAAEPADSGATPPVQVADRYLRYDRQVTMTNSDLATIRKQVVQRIRERNTDSRGRSIRPVLANAINNATLNSVKVLRPTSGRLALRVRYVNAEIPPLEQQYGVVFDWSPSDIQFVDQLVRRKLQEKGLPLETPTGRISV